MSPRYSVDQRLYMKFTDILVAENFGDFSCKMLEHILKRAEFYFSNLLANKVVMSALQKVTNCTLLFTHDKYY